MAPKTRDAAVSPVDAVHAVFAALEPLDEGQRQRVLASVTALLGMTASQAPVPTLPVRAGGDEMRGSAPRSSGVDRPKSLVELLQDKQPKNNAQKLALFAYYRERVEGQSRFARGDLRSYFAVAKEKPAGNYDRDFTQVVKLGWIHEDGSDSYLTSRGLEAVESGFASGLPATVKKAPKRSKSHSGRKTRR